MTSILGMATSQLSLDLDFSYTILGMTASQLSIRSMDMVFGLYSTTLTVNNTIVSCISSILGYKSTNRLDNNH